MSMPWAVCGYLPELEGLVRWEATPGILPVGLERLVKDYCTPVAKGQGPRGDLSGHLEGQSGLLGSMELWGFAYIHDVYSPTTLISRCYYYPIFTDEETEVLVRLKACQLTQLGTCEAGIQMLASDSGVQELSHYTLLT